MASHESLTREVIQEAVRAELERFASTTLRAELDDLKGQLQEAFKGQLQEHSKEQVKLVQRLGKSTVLQRVEDGCAKLLTRPKSSKASAADKGHDNMHDDAHDWSSRHVRTYVPKVTSEGERWRMNRFFGKNLKTADRCVESPLATNGLMDAMDGLRAATNRSAELTSQSGVVPSAPPSSIPLPPSAPAPPLPGTLEVDISAMQFSSFIAVEPFDGNAASDSTNCRTADGQRTSTGASRKVSPNEVEDQEMMPMSDAPGSRVGVKKSETRIWNSKKSGDSGQLSCRHSVGRMIYSWWFELTFVFLIFANAITMGVESDYSAAHPLEPTPLRFQIIEAVFCLLFTLEVGLRIFVSRASFFFDGHILNFVDLTIVVVQDILLVVTLFVRSGVPNLNVLRMIRLIRLVDIVRSVRLLKFVGEVRTIVWSVGASFKPLCGIILILSLVTYVFAIYLMESVIQHKTSIAANDRSVTELDEICGSMARCMLTLWQAMSGGKDWEEVSGPLLKNVGPHMGLLYSLYIAFCFLSLLNTITGVYVDSAMKIGRQDKDNYLISYLRHMFSKLDVDHSGEISWLELEHNWEHGEFEELLNSIGLDVSEAQNVFKLLDLNGTGSINAEEFLAGCIRLRSDAKALDMMVLMRETRRMFNKTFAKLHEIHLDLTDHGTYEVVQ